MLPQITVAFQTDKPLAAYGSLAAKAEMYGFDGVSVYNDMLYQFQWIYDCVRIQVQIILLAAFASL